MVSIMKTKTIIFSIIFILLASSMCFAVDSVYVWSNNTTSNNVNNNYIKSERSFLI